MLPLSSTLPRHLAQVVPGVCESLKVMSRDATRRIAEYAFEYAFLNNRAKARRLMARGVTWCASREWGEIGAWRNVRLPPHRR